MATPLAIMKVKLASPMATWCEARGTSPSHPIITALKAKEETSRTNCPAIGSPMLKILITPLEVCFNHAHQHKVMPDRSQIHEPGIKQQRHDDS